MNDDGKNAAGAELRAEFYSDLISPLVVSRSGKNYKIRPYHWGSELALTWLEQGECVLTEYLVDPPLGMLRREEVAAIFVSEHDLQRLIAQQTTKQEYSDQRSETQPASPEPDRPPRRKSGKKPSPVWQEIFDHFDDVVADKGKFHSVGSAVTSVEKWLETKNKSLSRRAIERGIPKYRPNWI